MGAAVPVEGVEDRVSGFADGVRALEEGCWTDVGEEMCVGTLGEAGVGSTSSVMVEQRWIEGRLTSRGDPCRRCSLRLLMWRCNWIRLCRVVHLIPWHSRHSWCNEGR